jgi:hypothetical protein
MIYRDGRRHKLRPPSNPAAVELAGILRYTGRST